MVAKQLLVLFEDDWELRGNGLGNVAELQYLPARFLLDIAAEFDLRLNFMVEVLQQIAFRRCAAASRDVQLQADLWDHTVQMMKARGHDVQLHIHPQWAQAVYRDSFFHVRGSWNIADWPAAERGQMLDDAIGYLCDLLFPIDRSYTINAFKAGAWGLQPSAGIVRDLARRDIHYVMGPGKGVCIRTSEFFADYTKMAEPLLPYYADPDDVCQIGSRSTDTVLVLPMPYYERSPWEIARHFVRRLKATATRGSARGACDPARLPPEIAAVDPLGAKQRTFRRLRGLCKPLILDVASSDFGTISYAIDQVFSRYLALPYEAIPVVVQSHTKGYVHNYSTLRRVFRHIVERYSGHVRFITFTALAAMLPQLDCVRAQPAAPQQPCRSAA